MDPIPDKWRRPGDEDYQFDWTDPNSFDAGHHDDGATSASASSQPNGDAVLGRLPADPNGMADVDAARPSNTAPAPPPLPPPPRPPGSTEPDRAGPVPGKSDPAMHEPAVCRICRDEGTPDNPIYAPCRCTGSIRHVHQDCLMEWLKHSGKSSCEVCGHTFTFSSVYAPTMPERIPVLVLLNGMIRDTVLFLAQTARVVVVLLLWFVGVPYTVFWWWQFVNAMTLGQPHVPVPDVPLPPSDEEWIKPVILGAPEPPANATVKFENTVLLALSQAVPPQFIRDVLEGQVLTLVTFVFAILLFLLREWILETVRRLHQQERQRRVLYRQRVQQIQQLVAHQQQLQQLRQIEQNLVRQNQAAGEAHADDEPVGAEDRAQVDAPLELADEYIPDYRPDAPPAGAPPPPPPPPDRLRVDELDFINPDVAPDLGGLFQPDPGVGAGAVAAAAAPPVDLPQLLAADPAPAADLAPADDAALDEWVDGLVPPANDQDQGDLGGFWEMLGFQGPITSLLKSLAVVLVCLAVVLVLTQWLPLAMGRVVMSFRPLSLMLDLMYEWRVLVTPVRSYLAHVLAQPIEYYATLTEALKLDPAAGCELIASVVPGNDVIWRLLGPGPVPSTPAYLPLDPVVPSSAQTFIDTLVMMQDTIGDSWTERAALIAVGHFWTEMGLALYVGVSYRTQAHSRIIATLGIEYVKALLTGIKVVLFFAIELVAFPTYSGILVAVFTAPLVQTTLMDQWAFAMSRPVAALFTHWFIGTMVMFHLANFVGLFRDTVRPGVMWFIRDPNDPNFSPFREIVNRPMTAQMRKMLVSMGMYLSVIGGTVGMTSALLALVPGLLPFRLPGLALADVPIDLIVFQIVSPLVAHAAATAVWPLVVTRTWLLLVGRALRLTSFLFGSRHADEEFTNHNATWSQRAAWAIQRMQNQVHLWQPATRNGAARDDGVPDQPDHIPITVTPHPMLAPMTRYHFTGALDPDSVPDHTGSLYCVPGFDGLRVVRRRVMFHKVNDHGHVVVPFAPDDPLAAFEPLRAPDTPPPVVLPNVAALMPAAADAEDDTELKDDPEHWTYVWLPDQFRARWIALIVLMIASLAASIAVAVASPLLLGREIMAVVTAAVPLDASLADADMTTIRAWTASHIHDMYSAAAGVLVLAAAWLVARAVRAVSKHARASRWAELRTRVAQLVKMAVKATWVLAVGWGAVPLLTGALIRVYLTQPLRFVYGFEPAPFAAVYEWGLGFIVSQIGFNCLEAFPDHPIMEALDETYRNGWTNLDLLAFNERIAWPLLMISAWLLLLPRFAGQALVPLIQFAGTDMAARIDPERAATPQAATLAQFMRRLALDPAAVVPGVIYPIYGVYLVVRWILARGVRKFRSWAEHVRDQEYLVERVLHDLPDAQRGGGAGRVGAAQG
ncbi:hypothetical protein GGF32_002925 [Allomyces javanicus]|nr:hypothetical protein GGF32_002925 [Allomyces javanicus]